MKPPRFAPGCIRISKFGGGLPRVNVETVEANHRPGARAEAARQAHARKHGKAPISLPSLSILKPGRDADG
jgi:hypothetical protein